MIRRALALFCVALGALATPAAQTTRAPGAKPAPTPQRPGAQTRPQAPRERTPAQQARDEWNRGAVAYRAGRYEEARRHFERARELDPKLENVRLYIARSIEKQYKPGVEDAENVARGEEAVAAYEAILADEPANDEALKSLAALHGQMRNEARAREVFLRRANDASLPEAKRAEAFLAVAARDWKCANAVTERKENREVGKEGEKAAVKYKMPADTGEFYRAQQCATSGLELAEQATRLAPENAAAWAYKSNLLRELSKLAEMEGNPSQKEFYDQQHAEAAERQRALGGVPSAVITPVAPVVAGSDATAAGNAVAGEVLNGKAVSKPEPEYPAIARAARASGVVTVQVVVDEAGNVVSARAVSGHPLLQQAAVNAALQARFSPTLLNGQPVKVSGVVTYNFTLD